MKVLCNLLDFIRYDIPNGIGNLVRWFPIVWRDRDWDWDYLAEIMEFKFRRMSGDLKRNARGNSARQCLICAELLKRLREDDFGEPDSITYRLHELRMKGWEEMLGRMIGKHLMSWWD